LSLNIIDPQGFRLNIGIVIINADNKVLWARRIGQNAWQFPQGGVQQGERLEEALYRELKEELGLDKHDVRVERVILKFLKYRLPAGLIRYDNHLVCIGQKQKWYLLRMISDDSAINLNISDKPEFEEWRWVSYWHPLRSVISFKKDVYRKALQSFSEHLFGSHENSVLDPFVARPSLNNTER
jgi:putative (di)nucleoside polyphosphate hydrolase